MHTVKINLEACTGCKECIDACFVDVIRWDEARGIPYGAYSEDCQICCVCEQACPTKAIEIIPDWKSKYVPKPLAAGRR